MSPPSVCTSTNKSKIKRKLPSTPTVEQTSAVNSVQPSPHSSHLNVNQKSHQSSSQSLNNSRISQIPSVVLLSPNNEAHSETVQNKPKLENVAEWLNKSFDTNSIITSKTNQNLYIPERQQRSNSLVYLRNGELNYNSNTLKQKGSNYLNDSNCDVVSDNKASNLSASVITLNMAEKIKINLLDDNKDHNLKVTSNVDLTRNNDELVSLVAEKNTLKQKRQSNLLNQLKSNKHESNYFSLDVNKSENNITNEKYCSTENRLNSNNTNSSFSNVNIHNVSHQDSNNLNEIQNINRRTSPSPTIEPNSPFSPMSPSSNKSNKSPTQRFNMPLVRSARNNGDNKKADHFNNFSEVSFKINPKPGENENPEYKNAINNTRVRSDSNKTSTPPSPIINKPDQFILNNKANQNFDQTQSRNNNANKMTKTNSTSSSLANFRSSSPYNPNRMNSLSSTNSNDINDFQNNLTINNNNNNYNNTLNAYSDAHLMTPNSSRKNSINDVDSGIDSSIKSEKGRDQNQNTRRNFDVTSSCDLTLPEYVPMSNDSVDLAKILENMKTASVSNKNEKRVDINLNNNSKFETDLNEINDSNPSQNAPLGELQVMI